MSAQLITGGTVYTADAEESVHANGAVLIVDGTIAAVGAADEVERAVAALDPARKAGLKTRDVRGMMVLPGFVNAHWHEMFAMRFPMRGALRPVSDRDDEVAFMGGGGDMHQISATFDRFDGLIEQMTPDEAQAIAEYSMWTQLRGGVTTLGDMGSLNRPHSMVAAAQRVGIRFSASTWASDAVCAPDQDRFVRTRDADGVLADVESLLRLASEDTSGRLRCRPSVAYVTNMTDELARGMAELVARHDTGFATHVGALRNEVDLMRRYYGETGVRRLAELGLVDERLMAGHCAFLDEDEQKLLLAGRAHISHSPGKYGPSGESSLTETGVVPALRRQGLDVSLSTDGSSMPSAGIAETMRAAWQMYNEMSADQTEVLPSDALAMGTRIAAKGLRWDDAVGSLETGKQADLVLVRTDDWRYLLNPRPLESFLWLAGSADVDTVIVGGRTLLSGGRGVEVDEAGLQERYLAALGSFTTRALRVPDEVVGRVLGRWTR
ncbi:amidohydrolase family protein [Streptomyces sp. MS2.AVA.5]|uniref:Amidohydrolase family protein n=1 Tax=Streptomyces achmelvichensis TaxID=3134111 RepID=A0ACC6PTF8_9ACTN